MRQASAARGPASAEKSLAGTTSPPDCVSSFSPRRRKARKTTARGYGWMHQQLRARWARRVQLGRVRCARCGRPIKRGEPWDLGHDDVDRRRYTGPEHRACNRATTGRRRRSRSW